MSQDIRSDQLHQVLGTIMEKPGEDSATADDLRAELARLRWEIGTMCAGLKAAAKDLPVADPRTGFMNRCHDMLRKILNGKAGA